jgi:hypothetical protein
MRAPAPAEAEAAADRVFATPAFDWALPSAAENWLVRLARRVADWLRALEQVHPWVYRVVIGAMLLVLVAILVHAAWTAWRMVRTSRRALDLPADPRMLTEETGAPTRAVADAAAREGRYADAMRLRWAAFDAALRASGALVGTRALTPREVVAEQPAPTATRLAPLVRTLYAGCYRGDPVEAAHYAAWAAALDAEWPAPARRVRAA